MLVLILDSTKSKSEPKDNTVALGNTQKHLSVACEKETICKDLADEDSTCITFDDKPDCNTAAVFCNKVLFGFAASL